MKDKGLPDKEQPLLRRKCKPNKHWEDWVIGFADEQDPEARTTIDTAVLKSYAHKEKIRRNSNGR